MENFETILNWVSFNKWTVNFARPITISSVELKTKRPLNTWEPNSIWTKIEWRTWIWSSIFSIFGTIWFRVIDLILACRVTIKIGYDWLWVVIPWKNGISPCVIWVNIDVWIIFQLALPKTCCIDFVKLPWRCQIKVELLSALKLNRQLLVFFAWILTYKRRRWFNKILEYSYFA